MLNKWIDDLGQEIDNPDDAVAFAIFVFTRLEQVRHHNFGEVCQMYLDWRKAAERIIKQSKAALHRVESQSVLEKLYTQVDRKRLVFFLRSSQIA